MNNSYIFKNKNKKSITHNDIYINDNEKKESKTRIKRQCINKEILNDLVSMIKEKETNDKKIFNMILLNTLLYLTGCRISEILVLNKSNIETLINNGKYTAYCSKTKTTRTLYLNQGGKELILFNLDMNDAELYINLNVKGLTNIYNNKLDKRTAYNWMDKYFKIITEKYYNKDNQNIFNDLAFNFHSYRTNFINQMCRINDNFDEVSRLVGHKNPYTTFIYWRELHIDEKKINENITKALL